MIRSEQLLKEAREQDHTCEFCYYEYFDDRAYPCSRCVCNQPTENLWKPKIKDEPQTKRLFTDMDGDVWEWRGDAWYCISGDEPQERSE